MAFFCPIFPKQQRVKAKEYEDSNYYAFDGGRSLYATRSLTALNAAADKKMDDVIGYDDENVQNDHGNFRVIVNENFEPTVDDEIRVRRGDIVRVLYRDHDWLYVVRDRRDENDDVACHEGFIPVSHCGARYDKNEEENNEQSKKPLNKKSKGSKNQNSSNSVRRSMIKSIRVRAFNMSGRRRTRTSNNSALADSNRVDLSKNGALTTKTMDKSEENINPLAITHDNGNFLQCATAVRPKALKNVHQFLQSLDERGVVSDNENTEEILRTDVRSDDANYAIIDKQKKTGAISSTSALIKYGDTVSFTKKQLGRLVAVYDFAARVEDDVDISSGDVLTLLNDDDPDWFWVRKEGSGSEGFVPSNYVRAFASSDAERVNGIRSEPLTNVCGKPMQDYKNLCNELLVVADFEPEAADDLRVVRGDWIYSYQTPAVADTDWLWAYCPRSQRYGFVPKSVIKTPEATKL